MKEELLRTFGFLAFIATCFLTLVLIIPKDDPEDLPVAGQWSTRITMREGHWQQLLMPLPTDRLWIHNVDSDVEGCVMIMLPEGVKPHSKEAQQLLLQLIEAVKDNHDEQKRIPCRY